MSVADRGFLRIAGRLRIWGSEVRILSGAPFSPYSSGSMRFAAILPILLLLSACASPGGPYPSLQPRAAETIDPRVPVERPVNDRPVTPALAARLTELVNQAHGGETAFEPAAAEAERLAA